MLVKLRSACKCKLRLDPYIITITICMDHEFSFELSSQENFIIKAACLSIKIHRVRLYVLPTLSHARQGLSDGS